MDFNIKDMDACKVAAEDKGVTLHEFIVEYIGLDEELANRQETD